MADDAVQEGGAQQYLDGGQIVRIIFQSNAGAFVIFAWMKRDIPEVAMTSLAFGAFLLVLWAVLFVSHLRLEYGSLSEAV